MAEIAEVSVNCTKRVSRVNQGAIVNAFRVGAVDFYNSNNY